MVGANDPIPSVSKKRDDEPQRIFTDAEAVCDRGYSFGIETSRQKNATLTTNSAPKRSFTCSDMHTPRAELSPNLEAARA